MQFAGVTREDYYSHRHHRFGKSIGEPMANPLWEEAVRCQWSAFAIGAHFGDEPISEEPRWSFQRFGASCTLLDNYQEPKRHLWIGGEHEDGYDPDFRIYNDVVITGTDGAVEIYGFPPDHFPPTDFHTATLVEGELCAGIYVIGCLGYPQDRVLGTTPVFRFDLDDMAFSAVPVRGAEPSWLHRHSAMYVPGLKGIAVWGGWTIDLRGTFQENSNGWLLNLESNAWARIDSVDLAQARMPTSGWS